MNAPDLGKYTADCDANGPPVLSRGQLSDVIGWLIREQPADAAPERIADTVDRAAGGPWLDGIEQLRERLG